ncbi:S9 family peptidase [Qipengyuania marisflavi]|uniref:S9 family peptidase n=2 Tax=Qipengyuania marisflavi TaxID=2486356 RepID=A0A5S3PA99_9SPHN|nr:S9 family peptidase [Qipengyuania marisflavi]
MNKFLTGVAGAALLSLPMASPLSAQSVSDDASVFGARESVRAASLSPSGNQLVYIASADDQGEAVYVVDLATAGAKPKRIMLFTEPMADLTGCSWATETQLVCRAYISVRDASIGEYLGVTRMFSVNSDGSDLKVLEGRRSMRALDDVFNGGSVIALDMPGEDGKVLMTRTYVKEASNNTRLANDKEGLGVVAIDLKDGSETAVETPDKNAIRYVADDTGQVRLKATQMRGASGYSEDEIGYFYRTPNSKKWEQLSRLELNAGSNLGFQPVAVDAKTNVAYGFEDGTDGFTKLYSVSLDGAMTRTPIVVRSDADVDQMLLIGRQRRAVGASFATEKRQIEYFDPDLKALAASLSEALPNHPLINIIGASSDESKLLIAASSDVDPGMLYLFDRAARALNPLLPLREAADGKAMGAMQPISYPAADGTMIPGYLTLPPGSDGKNLRAIVMPHGGPSSRDEWGFDWLVQYFAARGFAVLQPNFRGSSGYGAKWFGRNGFQAWRTAIGDVNDGARWLVSQGLAKPNGLAAVGWSYGGYAALQSQALDPGLFGAIVAIAPVTDLAKLVEDSRKFSNYRLVENFVGKGDHVTAGSPAQNAASFSAPVLLFHGTADQNVDIEQSRIMAKALEKAGKKVELVEYDDFEHDLDSKSVRANMLGKIDAFLRAELGN